MRSIFIKAYLQKNFGDDLFVKILTERYPHINFRIISIINYKNVFRKNVKVFSGFLCNIFDKFIKVISYRHFSLEKLFVFFNKYIIWIGGSMFMEKGTNPINKLMIPKHKNYYILGCNFGPYHTHKYFLTVKSIFSKATDICFRDNYSYRLFNNLNNVRVASDIVFSLDISNVKIINSKKVVISVINTDKIFSKNLSDIYKDKIIQLCRFFIYKDYKVVLMSYCKYEGDEKIISFILSQLNDYEKSDIFQYNYTGNITEALNVMADCEIVVGTRFHSIILGLLFNKTVIPIVYNQKTTHFLKDISFKGKYIDTNNINKFDVFSLSDIDLSYKHNISKQIKASYKQFYMLDKLLSRGDLDNE